MKDTQHNKHELYPFKDEINFGDPRSNEDSMFRKIFPETLRSLIAKQEAQLYLTINDTFIPYMKGCSREFCRCNRLERFGNCFSAFYYDTSAERLSVYTNKSLEEVKGYVRAFKNIHSYYDYMGNDELLERLSKAPQSSLYYNPFDGFQNSDTPHQEPDWIVEGLIPSQGIVSIYGPSESFKSFIANHLACSIATGSPFFGHQVNQGPLLYFAPEGGSGLLTRREAWKLENGWSECFVPYYSRASSFSFSSEEDREFLANKLNVSDEFAPRAVIFDTLGQCLGSYDENSAADMNRIARFLNDLKTAHDCSFIWIDHSGHEGKRSRGSSAKFDVLDAEFSIQRNGNEVTIRNTKMKDFTRADPIQLTTHERHNSLILEEAEPTQSNTDRLLQIINAADDKAEKSIRAKFYGQATAKSESGKQKAYKRALEELKSSDRIVVDAAGQIALP